MIEKKHFVIMLFIAVFVVMLMPFFSAGNFSSYWNKITGKATSTVTVNISIGIPEIRYVDNATMTSVVGGLNSGPLNTSIIINFSVYLESGAGNLDNSTARINFTKTGETTRQNWSCFQILSSGKYANYTCNVTMQWYDLDGVWNIGASINDTIGNKGINISANFSVGQTVGFQASSLTWLGLSPGQTNQTSAINLTLNNTGNKAIPVNATQINGTNLRGETTNTLAIWAGNTSVTWDSTNLASCISTGANETKASNLSAGNYVNVTMANLTRGNYITNNGNTGQEIYYFCFKTVGSDLTSQSYSTLNESAWTIRVL